LDSLSIGAPPCLRLSRGHADDVDENNRMVGLMGMGWDMGPPFWPYQAIYLLLFTINAPAFVLSMPILKLLNLQTLSLQYGA
jgi:hypothetical protein